VKVINDMKISGKKFLPISIFFILILYIPLLAYCTPKKKSVADIGTQKGILHFGNGPGANEIDPHFAVGIWGRNIVTAIFEGLVGENPRNLSPEPGVAKSWKIAKGNSQYIFKLRSDAKWSTGDTITAYDFIYSWKRLLSPKNGCAYAYLLYPLKNAKKYHTEKIKNFSAVGVKAKDYQTLIVTLEYPTLYFLRILQHHATFPVHKKTIEKNAQSAAPQKKWTRPRQIGSNGPFTLKDWTSDQIITVEKNSGSVSFILQAKSQ
jgi:oligopeptide transport system substrate-binding protein